MKCVWAFGALTLRAALPDVPALWGRARSEW